jgi:hypothetical protein
MQFCGGLGEIQILGHRHEIPQVTQFHNVHASLTSLHALATLQEPLGNK